MYKTDFDKYALSRGISSLTIHRYMTNFEDHMISPNIVEERTGNMVQMDVFSKLFTSRILFLGTEINEDVANIINCQLLYLQQDDAKKSVDLYINSPGGSVYAGMAIYDTIRAVKCPVHTTCTGLAASMASILLAAGQNGERSILPHSRVLIHQPLGNSGYAQASDIQIVNNEIQTLKRELFEILAEHTGQDYDKLIQLGDRDCWLTAKEAIELGVVDKIIPNADK